MYHEEKTFNIRFHLEAQFPDEYNGDEDSHAWEYDWETRIKPEIIKAVFQALRNTPSWLSHVRNRGWSATDEIEIVMTKVFNNAKEQSGY